MPSQGHSIAGMVAVATLVLLPVATGARQQPAAASPAYVGEEACLACHPNQSYTGTAHALATNVRTPAATHGCESCHGPGKAHAEGGDATRIANPGSLPVREGNDICLKCHDRGTHPAVAGSVPDPRASSCSTCHSVHAAKRGKLLKR